MKRHRAFYSLLSAALLVAACTGGSGGETTPVDTARPPETPGIAPTSTRFLPPSPDAQSTSTATAVPLALIVDGEAITRDEFNRALQRFHAGVPEVPTEQALERVAADYIDQLLLSQAAAGEGFMLTEADFQARLASLTEEAGGAGSLGGWLDANFYTAGIFERDLRRSIAAAWMRDRIMSAVPASTEQVRARHIRASTREEAAAVFAQLNDDVSFDILITIYDPEGLGELGWFPRGVLFEPAIEEAAFSLAVGDYSGVIETTVGFHIVQVTDYQESRALDPDALWALQLAALDDWLAVRRAQSAIELLAP